MSKPSEADKDRAESIRRGCHLNYNDGHQNVIQTCELDAFHHGMDTVCNGLAAEFAAVRAEGRAEIEREYCECKNLPCDGPNPECPLHGRSPAEARAEGRREERERCRRIVTTAKNTFFAVDSVCGEILDRLSEEGE
jgi:hypothetical protein